ncbi:helix-turn-helix domain-containing protein [Streptomyces ipomoeae]|uniref:helix-turn-helix domain-containing protein n=1 Tax=Streptomyces ipomoeae TaxID=103232 RepID=UPI00114726B0|nr:helix-turn-helix domain-containing protein [Streptomyces ipomoeae]TQE25614.1 XRE family transcriptional regulator [Streptomyces ipomoeae]
MKLEGPAKVREELAGWLRQLRDLTGRSLREPARDIDVSSSSLSRYFSGQAVPPWPAVVALCGAAGRDPRPMREVGERAKGEPQTSTAAPRRFATTCHTTSPPSPGAGRS